MLQICSCERAPSTFNSQFYKGHNGIFIKETSLLSKKLWNLFVVGKAFTEKFVLLISWKFEVQNIILFNLMTIMLNFQEIQQLLAFIKLRLWTIKPKVMAVVWKILNISVLQRREEEFYFNNWKVQTKVMQETFEGHKIQQLQKD